METLAANEQASGKTEGILGEEMRPAKRGRDRNMHGTDSGG